MGASVDSGCQLTSVEICAGAGGQARGLHRAGFAHKALLEIDPYAVATLRMNVDKGNLSAERILNEDLNDFVDSKVCQKLDIDPGDLDLLAGGVPCPPFSLAGRQLGEDDDRDLFPVMLNLVDELRPKAVMIENVRGLLEPVGKFSSYRKWILDRLRDMGYDVVPEGPDLARSWRILEARDFHVPQLRPRAILVAIRRDVAHLGGEFAWPIRSKSGVMSVYDALYDTMRDRCLAAGDAGKRVFARWKKKAKAAAEKGGNYAVAPTLVGGSKKHGGADLGPTRAKRAWAELGIDAMGVANDPEDCVPSRDLLRDAGPMLTVKQAAIIQGFPPEWEFAGGKTARYRQVGNAFPPPVAEAVGRAIAAVLRPELRRGGFLEGLEMEDANDLNGVQEVLFEPIPA
ncbi:DNA (cytosine-5-)-methyltransferase [Saccharopolyspora thermophila]|uniref:Cytosine-specific methyltransferase n=1 Tax=Saccharopolyspora thermophila TaxID=89367 RepID=A0ABP3M2S9_9PSEU